MSRIVVINGVEYPAKWCICPHCEGDGELPIYGVDKYLAHAYNVKMCVDCLGHGKYLVFDQERATPEQITTVINYARMQDAKIL